MLGDHRTACAGVLATRAMPLEHVCREAGARVVRNVRLADMNLDVPVADARRIGSQLQCICWIRNASSQLWAPFIC